MNSSPETSKSLTAQPSLQRVVGVSGVAFLAFNGIVGSGIFGLPALVAALLGPAAILAYLVCVVLVGLVGLCFAESGSRITSPGGLYAYARVPFGPIVGGVAGTLIWCAFVLSNAAVANFLTGTLALPWPPLEGGAPRVLPQSRRAKPRDRGICLNQRRRQR